jgi:hypothetical protein
MAGLARSERVVIVLVVLATALAGIAHYADWDAVLAFAIATVALAGLAHIVSFSTEQVGQRFGPAATGLMQSTLGNLPELFVVVFALREGEVVVAQTSIIGSLRRSTRRGARAPGSRSPSRSACSPSPAPGRPSSRTGSSPPCARRSISSEYRRPSPGSSSSPWPATRSRTSSASCSPTRARRTLRSPSS